MGDAENTLWEHCMARGRVVLETWPEGERAYASPALNGLVSAVMFRDVDPEFTQALIDFARGLHVLVLAQREQREARRRARAARRAVGESEAEVRGANDGG